jgi:hypothetical protein
MGSESDFEQLGQPRNPIDLLAVLELQDRSLDRSGVAVGSAGPEEARAVLLAARAEEKSRCAAADAKRREVFPERPLLHARGKEKIEEVAG